MSYDVFSGKDNTYTKEEKTAEKEMLAGILMSLDFSEDKITKFSSLIDEGFSAEKVAEGIEKINALTPEEVLMHLRKGIIPKLSNISSIISRL